MAIYYIDKQGIQKLPDNFFTTQDTSLVNGSPSFEQKIGLTASAMRDAFLGAENYAFDYLLNSGINFKIVTHPDVTFSCQDKIVMYNVAGCNLNGDMGEGEQWELEDTIKAIYFWHNETENYHMAIIPGQITGTHINQRESFSEICANLGINIKKKLRLFPVGTELAFGIGLEGCLSPFPPLTATVDGEQIESQNMIDAIYFDKNHLATYSDSSSKLDDLSISMRIIPCVNGHYIKREVGIGAIEDLRQLVQGERIPLEIKQEDGRAVAYVNGPLFGDYRPSTIKAGEDKVTLKFSYIPNHMFSVVMSYPDIFNLLNETFPGKVHAVEMQYKH